MSMLEQVKALVREVAQREVTPRFLKVTHSHKVDGSLFTEADMATQAALESALPQISDVPVLGEEMTETQQRDAWNAGWDGASTGHGSVPAAATPSSRSPAQRRSG